jgi:glycosyltransferase involved in cell wall biosynthesis
MGKKVLIINYYWPPSGGPAVQRWLSIANHLVREGIHCSVLTVDENQAAYPVIDPQLSNRIDRRIEVYRTGTSELFWLYKQYAGGGKLPASGLVDESDPNWKQKIARFFRGNFFLPDPRRGWNKEALRRARQIIGEQKIDVIITAGPPHSTHLIGLALKERNSVHWIADFHDYWTDAFYLKKFYRTLPAQWIDKAYEKKVLKNADLILCHCQAARILFSSKVSSRDIKSKIRVHTVGYEEELFPEVTPAPQPEFAITYTGSMPGYYDPRAFMEALRIVRGIKKEVPLVFRFVGLMSPKIREMISQYGLDELLEEVGYVSHLTSIDYLYKSSILFLINPRLGDERMIVPGKLYEYLAVRKPIIFLGPADSENARIITDCEAGQSFERHDAAGLASYLSELMDRWTEKKHVDLENDNENYKKYGRERESRQLALIIESMVSDDG